jgi:glycosyltransferase involved in cell wall biosynthesis
MKRVGGVITVNQSLADWAKDRLRVPADRVRYIPNFVAEPGDDAPAAGLPGKAGMRIVCVANFRPQKDHLNLLEAMRAVLREMPEAHLILLGHGLETDCYRQIDKKISQNGLKDHVSVLGPRNDVDAVLRACDIGVLSSSSEGLPLALLEYGLAGLAVVATKVGQCDEVLGGGRCGLLAPPGDSAQLAKALISLLGSLKKRQELGRALNERVQQSYSPEAAIEQITAMYEAVVPHNQRCAACAAR